MSFQEKSAISMLLIMVVAYAWYFLKVFALAEAGPVDTATIAPLMFGMIIGVVVLSIIAHILITGVASARGDQDVDATDERDKLIEMSANSKSSYILAVGALAAMGMALYDHPQFVIAHVLLAALVLSEVIKLSLKIFFYRRGH